MEIFAGQGEMLHESDVLVYSKAISLVQWSYKTLNNLLLNSYEIIHHKLHDTSRGRKDSSISILSIQ